MFHIFGPERYDPIFDRIRYLTGLKSGITDVDSHNYAKIEIDSDVDLPLEHWQETLTTHNVVILIQLVFNKKSQLVLL